MSARAWRIIDWAIPTIVTVVGMLPSQYVDSIKERGGWWAIGVAVVVPVGRVVYQLWKERK